MGKAAIRYAHAKTETHPPRGRLSWHLQRRFQMTDFRDPNDQFYGNSGYEPPTDNGNRWGWIAGAAFLVVVIGLAFSVGH
jgi:hypothetical protein